MNIYLLYAISIGYLLGSIPFALVIGKVFYHTDIRKFGSGNLGGTNAGRVLGKGAGISVIALDILKVVLAVYLVSLFDKPASIWAGFAAAFGHCYPIFANFKGGKAAATMFGFLLSTAIFTFQNAWYVFVPFIFFIITLKLSKMVSLSSMCAAITSSIFITIMQGNIQIILASYLLTILVIYRHRENIKRIKDGSESKISWM
ncbi:MAG: glycerol-3-phosphate 1-O-acyltransferase PlsY [Erysipelotrichaceae bacterium]